jgi:sugar lactone lactonase YvrE
MPTPNPLRDWRPDRASIRTIGVDLRRPECILAEPDGTLWTADARGGVVRIGADGGQRLITQHTAPATAADSNIEAYILRGTLPNGLAFDANGDILIANFGTNVLERMTREGHTSTLYTEVDGKPLGKTNFVLRDSKNRIWLTVTTRLEPWTRCVSERTADGYVALIDERGIRIVVDGFVGTNEIRLDAREEWLYVVETNARRISRLRVQADGALTNREVYGPSDLGGTPDGFAFDAYGNLWTTLVTYDRLVAITPDGDLLTLLDDGNPAEVEQLDRHYFARTLGQQVLVSMKGGKLAPWMASVTFGGPDLRTVYIGSLMGTTIPWFRSPVAGLPMVHWNERRGH